MQNRQPFNAEFKHGAIRLMKTSTKPAAALARELGVPRNRLYKWAQDAEKKGDLAFKGSGRPKASTDELSVLQRENARLKEANEILKKSGDLLRQRTAMRYAWIKTQSDHSVRTLCAVLDVSTSGYYAWQRREPSRRALDSVRLLQKIVRIHSKNREAYGTLRVWRRLRNEGERCGVHRVQRLRQVHVIQTKRRRRYAHARGTYQRVPAAPNRLAWPFSSTAPNRIWVADITYVPTKQGWLYLATELDMHSRRFVGSAISDRADQPLASAALDMALTSRTPEKGAIHHSDQRVQYTCKAYQQHLHAAGQLASMSRKGMPYDNAMMESFFASIKQELTHHERFETRDEVRSKVFEYIEVFYNRQWLHSGLDYQSPEQFEKLAVA